MNVAQLIEELKKQPLDAPVTVYDDHTGDDRELTVVELSTVIRYIPAGQDQYVDGICVSFR